MVCNMAFIYERKMNYYETDMMGIIHHSNYIRFMEEARIAFLDSTKMPFRMLGDRGITVPVLYVNCEYKQMVRINDIVQIELKVTKYTGVKMQMDYVFRNKETGEITTTGSSGHCFINEKGDPIILKKEFPEYHENILSYLEK